MRFLSLFKINKQPENGKEKLLVRAQQGDADAMFELGEQYEKESDYAEAEKWFLQAVDKGHALSKYYLSLNYSAGMGSPAKIENAIQFLTELIEEEGCEVYGKDLAWIYGDIRKKNHPVLKKYYDLDKAEHYYLMTIKTRNEARWTNALYNLGMLYAGNLIYPHADDAIQNPKKAAYCLYMAGLSDGYDMEEYNAIISKTNLHFDEETLAKWEFDFRNRDFTL